MTDDTPHPFTSLLTRKDELRLILKRFGLRVYWCRNTRQWEIWPSNCQISRRAVNTGHRVFAGSWHACYEAALLQIFGGNPPRNQHGAISVEFTCSTCIGKADCELAFNADNLHGTCAIELRRITPIPSNELEKN